ncbi:hypothetical protein [Tissierella creatinophila]|uniref:Uncharacterized protein n=1 Tax=Tissierella creatinophila DSM 6911 TaxID=1123403 RepID=A0A1U7M406_TISCR|nr:hypothetical protein [Tissierella creatinophila]OLS02015.1 hypothetical protein TICRE_20190 [Tissierella creatinophila DSM 6911]
MKYILHVFGHKLADNMVIECADDEDLAIHARSFILDEKVEQVIAEKVKEYSDEQ